MMLKYMIQIIPMEGNDGCMDEVFGAPMVVTMPSSLPRERVVEIAHFQLHESLNWMKRNLTLEAMERLIYGGQEQKNVNQLKHMIQIIPMDGNDGHMDEVFGSVRWMCMPRSEKTVEYARRNLHDGLDWLKSKLTPEAVERLIYGKQEE